MWRQVGDVTADCRRDPVEPHSDSPGRRAFTLQSVIEVLTPCDLLAGRRHDVASVGDHGVATGAAVDRVLLPVARLDPVVAGAAEEAVASGATDKPVVAGR